MPNIKSQEKRDRQAVKRTLKNKALKTRIKSNKKKLLAAVENKDFESARNELSLYFKSLDKAAKKSAVSKNFAANKKSKAAKLLNSLKQ
ncbi:MAG: 30S ribosomal protein S20 [Actinobacteria bacterium]|nr:30S ribosomal protein S20 [Cyanobacteriota bacterium]MCL5772136.1 30S ribosomal protein S20 [Actinomycetota bacterium]